MTLHKQLWAKALALCVRPIQGLAMLGLMLGVWGAGAHAQTNTPATAPPPIKIALIEAFSGAFANTGDAVYRNVLWAVERSNAQGGVVLNPSAMGSRRLQVQKYDSKGQVDDALGQLKAAIDDGAQVVMQGNSSAVALALVEAINKHNEREPGKRVVFLNYSAVDPILTNEKCSFWHFRFDAHADMRMAALMEALKPDLASKKVYLIGQDYSFGQAVLREAKRQLQLQRPDIAIVGEELHPIGRVKDFAPYLAKIKASGAQAVITGNWGSDLTLLVKAAKEAGFDGKFYTFYGNALGAPTAFGDAGVGQVIAVAEWMPNVAFAPGVSKADGDASNAFYKAFKARFPNPAEDYLHLRMHMMVQALVQSLQKMAGAGQLTAQSIDIAALARTLETQSVTFAGQTGTMRAADHQFQQPLVVGVMDRLGSPGVSFDVEGSGFGFRVIHRASAQAAQMPSTCKMMRY
jgi:branched-chain amino acid transport system substrate-binding protein